MGLSSTASEATVCLSPADGEAAEPAPPSEHSGRHPAVRQRCVEFKVTKENMML